MSDIFSFSEFVCIGIVLVCNLIILVVTFLRIRANKLSLIERQQLKEVWKLQKRLPP